MRLSDKEHVAASSAESRTKKRSLELLPNEISIDRVVANDWFLRLANLTTNIYTQNLLYEKANPLKLTLIDPKIINLKRDIEDRENSISERKIRFPDHWIFFQ